MRVRVLVCGVATGAVWGLVSCGEEMSRKCILLVGLVDTVVVVVVAVVVVIVIVVVVVVAVVVVIVIVVALTLVLL